MLDKRLTNLRDCVQTVQAITCGKIARVNKLAFTVPNVIILCCIKIRHSQAILLDNSIPQLKILKRYSPMYMVGSQRLRLRTTQLPFQLLIQRVPHRVLPCYSVPLLLWSKQPTADQLLQEPLWIQDRKSPAFLNHQLDGFIQKGRRLQFQDNHQKQYCTDNYLLNQ